MDPKNNFSFQSHNYFHRLSKALEFAVSEWLLIFLLFIEACFTYLIAKFASYCQLEGPCLLCTRYDHLLSKDKTGIYWDSICNHHKSDLSSLVLRHVHDKNLLPTSSIHDASESLFENGEHCKNEKNIFVDKSLESCRSSDLQKIQINHSLEVEYQKVGVNSDNESELLVSDNETTRDLVPEVLLKSDSHIEVLDLQDLPATVVARDAEELKWQNDEKKEDMPLMTEQNSLEEAPSANIAETPVDASLEIDDPPKMNEAIKDPITETETEPCTTTNGHQMSNYFDLGDAYKLAISTKARQLSGKFLDQKSFKESSTKVNEDLKILLSHRSNDNLISPKLSFNSDELSGIQFLQRRISLERNESNISLDGSIVSEIDGESVVDRLRRQVEHDKKLMGALYKELEEERNASAVATNQAMAMITRLQEEKAELYTEALQYLRMMEEQAEYNSEALQNANDLIEEKDKQIQDLEEMLRKMSEDVRE
ncbi:unnamed protein product [Lactuca virosa]|uniref:GTD-binding domain-containing protein n=1 Tax=Lactuca virosa TaxID=75947 RepID=A0AAU9PDG8_9ASTR|nr:unnamed protein product [Lactuca virosa]